MDQLRPDGIKRPAKPSEPSPSQPTLRARLSPLSALIGITCASAVCLSQAGETAVAFRKSSTELRSENRSAADIFAGVPTEPITLQRAIQLALQKNLDVKFENVGIRVEQGRVRFAVGAFDPVFSINVTKQSLRRLENVSDIRSADVIRQNEAIASNVSIAQQVFDQNNIARSQQGLPALPESQRPVLSRDLTTSGLSSTTFSAENFQAEASIVGRTPWGMRYQVLASGSKLRNTFTGDTRQIFPQYETVAQLTIVQPLLRGFGTDANMADVRISRIGERIQVLDWKQRITSVVQGVMAAYYDMAFALQDIRVREDAVNAGQKLIDLYKRRVELGFNSPIDIRQAEVAVSIDREQMIVSRNVFLERQFALKRLIIDQYKIEDPRIFIPENAPRLDAPGLNREELLHTAYANRFDYRQAILKADAQNVRLRFAKNQLLPQLDLVASYGLNGLGTSVDNAIDQGFGGRTPSWSVGVNFSVPLGNVQPRANYSIARSQKEQALLGIKQAEVTVGSDVDQILARIETSRQRVATAVQTRQLAEETVRISYRRLEEGLISSFDIIEFQRRLYDAKSRELGARADLNKSITQLWLVTATVIERAGIGFIEPKKP